MCFKLNAHITLLPSQIACNQCLTLDIACQFVDAYGAGDKLIYCLVRSIVRNVTIPTDKNVHTVIDQWSIASSENRTEYAMRVMENKNDYVSDADFHTHLQVIYILFLLDYVNQIRKTVTNVLLTYK